MVMSCADGISVLIRSFAAWFSESSSQASVDCYGEGLSETMSLWDLSVLVFFGFAAIDEDGSNRVTFFGVPNVGAGASSISAGNSSNTSRPMLPSNTIEDDGSIDFK